MVCQGFLMVATIEHPRCKIFGCVAAMPIRSVDHSVCCACGPGSSEKLCQDCWPNIGLNFLEGTTLCFLLFVARW